MYADKWIDLNVIRIECCVEPHPAVETHFEWPVDVINPKTGIALGGERVAAGPDNLPLEVGVTMMAAI